MTTDAQFSFPQLEIVRFCAIECKLQMSGELSVWYMVEAWQWAMSAGQDDGRFLGTQLSEIDKVLHLGSMVEPERNARGFRKVAVSIGGDVKDDWRSVPRLMENLCSHDAIDNLTPAEWFKAYEEIHPFVDGNGRTGQILFNWLGHTLDAPRWAPDFWNDPRRVQGAGC